MKRLAACLGFLLLCHGPAMAQSTCEPEKVAQKYPTLAGRPVVIGVSPFYAPFSYADPTNVERLIGNDIELSEAALTCVGLKYEYLRGAFSSLLPTITGGRADVMVANLYFTPERNKVLDFVIYMKGGAAMLVRKGNPHKIKSMDDLCGLKTNATSGSYSQPILEKVREKCRADGKPEMDLILATEADAAFRQLINGRVDFILDNVGSAAARSAADPDNFEISFTNITNILVGVGIKKGNDALVEAYNEGFKIIHDNGTMAKIFDKYKLDRALIAPIEIKR